MAKAMFCLALAHYVGASIVRQPRPGRTANALLADSIYRQDQLLDRTTDDQRLWSSALNPFHDSPFQEKVESALRKFRATWNTDERQKEPLSMFGSNSRFSGPSREEDVKDDGGDESMLQKRGEPMAEGMARHSHLHEGDMCIRVCVDCRYRMSIHWAALCRKECMKGVRGAAFSYCFAAWHLEKGN